ncbi:hypothetical protein [Micromonospora sp. NPDC049240]|uniref:hypothetical protein n=1 Tax=Micromonospora sp. NPDC049240 TaxID=3155151 RepID=UPI0033F6C384
MSQEPSDDLAERVADALVVRRSLHEPYPPEAQIEQGRYCLSRFSAGEAVGKIARDAGLAERTVKKRIAQAADPDWQPSLDQPSWRYSTEQRKEQADKCLALRRDGMTIASIAKDVGIDRTTVWKRINQALRDER